MKVDFERLATLVREDRGKRSQEAYGKEIGLTQSQVSRIEKRRLAELSYELSHALQRRFGYIPELGDGKKSEKRTPPTLAEIIDRPDLIDDLQGDEPRRLLKDAVTVFRRVRKIVPGAAQ